MSFSFTPVRPPAISSRAMVCTSQPLATEAGLSIIRAGGNAADAAVTAAAVLCVTEPMSTGIGGDAFAIVAKGSEATGLDAAGPAPRGLNPKQLPTEHGPDSVTVPGAVGGWAALLSRFGTLGLDSCLAPAIDIAERGFAVAPHCARLWSEAPVPGPEHSEPPRAGDIVTSPLLGQTLRRIADLGPDGIYRGPIAEAIAAVTLLTEEEMGAFSPRWVEPLKGRYRGMDILELPAPTQGVAALEALAILEGGEPTLSRQVASARLALEDAISEVRDGRDVAGLLADEHIATRRNDVPKPVADHHGGTVYLSVVDEDRLCVSFIQSTFHLFGSGVVPADTGIVLGNRGHCFSVTGESEPGRRPYNTTIPGMLFQDGDALGPFGIMGGFIQAQAHMQFVSSVVDDGLDPQAALDRPRFRVDGDDVLIEPGLSIDDLKNDPGHVRTDESVTGFGGGQAIFIEGDALVGGSDARKDGYAGSY